MELSLKELKVIKDALGTLDLEYGVPDAVALQERVRDEIRRRESGDSPDACPAGVSCYRLDT